GHLVDPGPRHVAADREEPQPPPAGPPLGLAAGDVPWRIGDTTIAIPLPAAERDRRDPCERLDVVEQGRPGEQPVGLDHRRAVAGLGAMLLDRLDQRRLLAADVAAGALEDLQLEGPAGAQHVGADDPQLPRPADLRLYRVDLIAVLMPDVDISSL